MRRLLGIAIMCGGLAACALPGPGPVAGPPGDLHADRQACNTRYPPHLGNYLAHAQCVNAAVERDAIPAAHYPDLVRLQEQLRVKYSAAIDERRLSPREGEHKMAEADNLVTAAMRDRDNGKREIAERRLDRLQAMLE
ncbi:MAG TPA: hypothetical protein VG308_04300 [Stellaceae bacterium]|jgi:hypothetical protein|nr:hypothetical protein [Stellaceae bacterium]